MTHLLPPEYLQSLEFGVVPTAASKKILRETLGAAGLEHELSCQTSHSLVRCLRETAVELGGAPVLFVLDAESARTLVPERLSKVVWYIWLPAHLSHLAVLLTDVCLDGNAALSGDPWRSQLYVKLRSDFEGLRWTDFAIRADEIPVEAAVGQGFAVLLVDNGKAVFCSGVCAGEDVLMGLSASGQASTFDPGFLEPLERLQARARAVERTGADPAGPAADGALILRVERFLEMACKQKLGELLQARLRASLSLSSTDEAEVGHSEVIVTAFEECPLSSESVVRVRVLAQVFEACRAGTATSTIVCARVAGATKMVWFLVVDAGRSLYLVYAGRETARLGSPLALWLQSADFPVLVENLTDGRSLRVEPGWLPEEDFSSGVGDFDPLSFALDWAARAINGRNDNVVIYTSKLVSPDGRVQREERC